MFQVRLDKMVTKWAGSIEIGVTSHAPSDLEFKEHLLLGDTSSFTRSQL